LVRVFKGFLENRPSSETRGALFLFKCDSTNVVDIYNRGGSNGQEAITRACKQLFLLQLKFQCTLRLEWIPTGENKAADELTREDPLNDVCLANWMFLRLCERFDYECDVDLMASSANAQSGRDGRKLEFYSRYYDEGCAAVDVFSVDVCWHPRGRGVHRARNFCFPPQPMIFSVLSHLKLCGACALVVLPVADAPWESLVQMGLVDRFNFPGHNGVFLKFRKGEMRPFRPKVEMRAVLLDFGSREPRR